jgi:hypothetical protein
MADNSDETMRFRWEWYDNIETKWKIYSNEVQDVLNDTIKNDKKTVKPKNKLNLEI